MKFIGISSELNRQEEDCGLPENSKFFPVPAKLQIFGRLRVGGSWHPREPVDATFSIPSIQDTASSNGTES
jgi:hypothetical protein